VKRYIFTIPIFFILLGAIIFYLIRWNEIVAITNKFAIIQELSYGLEIQNQKQKSLLKKVKIDANYNSVVIASKEFKERIKLYTSKLTESNDKLLEIYAKKIDKKSDTLEYIYEDIKSDTALMKNSTMWLSKSYRKYLNEMTSSEFITPKLMENIFDILNANSLDQLLKYKNIKIDNKIFNKDKLNTHLNILYNKRKSLIELDVELNENDIYVDLHNVIKHINALLVKLEYETSSIIKSLLMSTLFLIIFGLIVHVKEIWTRHELDKFKSELQQFVDALNESAIVSKSDTKGIITFVNDKFCEISEYSKDELIGKNHNIIRHPDMPAEVFKNLWDTVGDKKVFRGTIKNRKKSGDAYYVDSVIVPMLDVNNEILSMVFQASYKDR